MMENKELAAHLDDLDDEEQIQDVLEEAWRKAQYEATNLNVARNMYQIMQEEDGDITMEQVKAALEGEFTDEAEHK